jgi:hypothetical protein
MGAAFGVFAKNVRRAAECSEGAPDRAAGDGAGRGRGLAAVLSARQMILDIIGYLLADGRKLKHLVFDNRIVGLFGIRDIQENNVPDVSRLSL